GTLYGGSNIGGAIKYVSKLPSDDFEAKVATEYGNYDTVTESGFVSGALVPGTLDVRVSSFYTNSHGYIDDTTLGQTVDRGAEYGGRMILKYNSDATTAYLIVAGDKIHTGAENLYYTPASPTDYSLNIADGTLPMFRRSLYSASLHIDHQFSDDVSLTSISSFFQSYIDFRTDIDKGPVPFLTGYSSSWQNVASQELRLANSGGGPGKWIIGLFAQSNDTPNNFLDTRSFNGDPGDAPSWSNPALYSDLLVNPTQKHAEFALFGNYQYSIDRWIVEAGLRADYNDSSMTDTLNEVSMAQHDTEIMPKFSATYHVSDTAMIYAVIARCFEPGDLTEGADAVGSIIIERYKP
ncbi:MAG: hypothetical protein ACRD3S_09875, partial [Terracidiphilus sp.]